MKLFLQILFKEIYSFLTDSNYRKFLKLAFLYGNKPRYTNAKVRFLDYEILIVDYLSFIWQFKEIFVDENYMFNSTSRSPVIYDCGANIGMSCIFFKKKFPDSKIIAFEPDPKVCKVLSENLKNYQGIEIINKAVWINNDEIEFSAEGADAGSIYGNKNKIKIKSIRLKDLIESENKIDMLKIDIEGAEVEILKDCKNNLNNVKNIFIEYHSFIKDHQALSSLLKILEENNFRYFIKQPMDRKIPFVNKMNKNYPEMDLQLNIFAYKEDYFVK